MKLLAAAGIAVVAALGMGLMGAAPAVAQGMTHASGGAFVDTARPTASPTGGILISTDGVNFASTTSAPLFDVTKRIIPGGSQSASLYVRNTRSTPVSVALHADDVTFGTAEFARLLTVTAAAPGATGWAANLADGQCLSLLAGLRIAPGDTARVNLAVGMSPEATGSQGQSQLANFNVLVSAVDASAPATPSGCVSGPTVPGFGDDSTESSPALASTGLDVMAPLFGSAILVAAGVVVAAASRRRRNGRRDVTGHAGFRDESLP